MSYVGFIFVSLGYLAQFNTSQLQPLPWKFPDVSFLDGPTNPSVFVCHAFVIQLTVSHTRMAVQVLP